MMTVATKPQAFGKIAKGVASGAGLTFVTVLVGILNLRLIVGSLSGDVAGVWIVLLTIGNYLVFFDVGFGPTLSREIAFAEGRATETKHHDQATLIATTQATVFIISILLLCIGAPAGWYFLSGSASGMTTTELVSTWSIFLVGGLLAMNGSVAHSSLFGLGHIAQDRLIRIFAQVTWLCLTFVFLRAGFGIRGAAAAWVLQAFIGRFAAFIVLYRTEPWIKTSRGEFNKALFRQMLAPSLRWAATTLGALLILQSGNLIVASVVGLAAVSEYEAVSKISLGVMTLGLLIATASSPFLSRSYAAQAHVGFNLVLFRNLKLGVSVAYACAVFAVLFGENIIEVWLGPGHFAGVPTLSALMIMSTLEVHHVIFATGAMAAGFVPFAPFAMGAGLINVFLGILLTRQFGIFGMAISTMVAQLLTNNWFAPYFAFKKFDLSVSEYLRQTVWPIAKFAFASTVLLVLVRYAALASGLTGPRDVLAFGFAIHALLVPLLLYACVLDSNEKIKLRQMMHGSFSS